MPEITIVTVSNEEPVSPTVKTKLAKCISKNDWGTVVTTYEECREAQTAKIDDSLGTALHVAVKLNDEQVVKDLVSAIIRMRSPNQTIPLEIGNGLGNTPLHVAASKGFERICRCIVGERKERLYLTKLKNNNGETPLFLAALNWNKYAFAYLLSLISRDSVTIDDLVRNNGDSILHCAITNEDFDLAVIIMHYYGDLLRTHANDEGYTPLKALADKPSAFKSGSGLSGWKLVLYHWTLVGPMIPENAMDWLLRTAVPPEMYFPMNYATLRDFFKLLSSVRVSLFGPRFPAQGDYKDYTAGVSLPSNYGTMQQFVSTTVGCIFGIFRVVISKTHFLEEVTMKKKKNQWSGQLLKELMEKPGEAFSGTQPAGLGDDSEPDMDHLCYQCDQVYNQRNRAAARETSRRIELVQDESKPDVREETAFAIAARNGIVEMVEEILSKIPNAISDTSSKNENVLLLAARNRHALVVEALKERLKSSKPEIWNDLIDRAVDGEGNTILHLAAKSLGEGQPGQIAGFAMQMMWDTKWFQYIKDEVPRHYNVTRNTQEKTAEEIFKVEHKTLIKDSSDWLKDTSESCSVVAALIAGVSFATACTVPGGTDKGEVPLQGKPAFNAFAISSLVGLCFSVTALAMFLSILTSRKEAKDFRIGLPLKLLLGLSSLFLSTIAMFVSFCSGHFFLINKTYKKFIFPLYGACSFPVLFFAIAQFPL